MAETRTTILRATDPDDAPYLHRLYAPGQIRAALLDNRREPIYPTLDELQEILIRRESIVSQYLYTVLTPRGEVLGFALLRGIQWETQVAEAALLLLEDAYYTYPEAVEAANFLKRSACERLHLRQMLAVCLDTEAALRKFYLEQGFHSLGVQREVLYTKGGWHHLETFGFWFTSSS
jgi:RimJ/RimL family protein N-acetyltransferase